MSSYTYIIVGGGTAGVVIASRLSHSLPDARIALLEAGPNAVDHPHVEDPNAFVHLPADGLRIDYDTTPQLHCNNRLIWAPAGNMLSGSSGTNLGMWTRASSTDYAIIAERAGHRRFEFKNLLPYFKKTETFWDSKASSELHGFDGPIKTVGGREYPLSGPIRNTCEKLGHRFNPDATLGDPTGFSPFTQNFRVTGPESSERQHSAKVYDLSKVEVMCEAPVAKVLFDEKKRATGVLLIDGRVLTADKEVVACCGAYKTPQLLMLSGVGPSDELAKHGIPQVVESPGVGRNLFDHLALFQYYKLRDPAKGQALPFNGNFKPEYGQGAPMEWLLYQNIPPSDLKPVLAAAQPDVDDTLSLLQPKRCHILTIPFYMPALAEPEMFPNINLMDGTHILMIALHLLPVGRGTVTLSSVDPKVHPVIDPNYLSTEMDRYAFRRAARENIRLTETAPFADEIAGEEPPKGSTPLTMRGTDEEVDARIRATCSTIAHPQGTCALGTVLDDEFRVKGVERLRVCDASVFPEPVGSMPQATVYAIAELSSDLIAKRK